ncbi:MAG: carbon-nitrogen hydrolase family protein [Loktanella sp.]|nr:carbon-nitrogen hydrolase family protein [Loktanella sp.]
MKVGVLQLTASDDPAANLAVTRAMVRDAAGQGATLICTPEVTNCVSMNRGRQAEVLHHEGDDPTLEALQQDAQTLGIWIALGSLALKTDDADGRFANRSLLIGPDGAVAARYDKIHMFDVQISETETYRESAGYRPGDRAVLAKTPQAALGLCICYDMRFAPLALDLARAGADMLLYPSAFAPDTGAAHWETLLRARAIETGCFVVAAAQTGTHPATAGKQRRTHGHSLIVSPWGEVLLDAGTGPGVHVLDLDMEQVAQTRRRIPSLGHFRPYDAP